MPQTEPEVDDSDHPALSGQSGDKINPKCMTKQHWVETQSRDKTINEIIQLFKTKELYCRKGNENDTNEMKQFIRQWNRLFMRNGILY